MCMYMHEAFAAASLQVQSKAVSATLPPQSQCCLGRWGHPLAFPWQACSLSCGEVAQPSGKAPAVQAQPGSLLTPLLQYALRSPHPTASVTLLPACLALPEHGCKQGPTLHPVQRRDVPVQLRG